MEIAICDDEKNIREQIAELVEMQGAGCRIRQFSTGKELLAEKRHFDIIFLDIQMEGKNGIETARELRRYDERAVIIFVTVVKEYVFEAFDVSAFHYLLKPISGQKFAEVFASAKKQIEKQGGAREGSTLFIKKKNCSFVVKQREILYIESRANKVVIHTVREDIEAYYAMSKLAEELDGSFYRCHRGYFVNMEHIAQYTSNAIELSNGEQVYMAKEKYHDFVKAYMRYLDGGGAADV